MRGAAMMGPWQELDRRRAMMYGAKQVREPRSLGRRMGDSVIAAVCTGLMAVLCIGMLWTMSHVGQ